MLRFQWDSLQRGDHIFAHDQADPADVAVRPADVADIGRIVRLGRWAVHDDAVNGESTCWCCQEHLAAA